MPGPQATILPRPGKRAIDRRSLTPATAAALLTGEPDPNPNTMATFQRAGADTEEVLEKVLKEHYTELVEMRSPGERFPLKIDILDVWADRDANGEPKGRPLKLHGCACAATISIVPKAQRALGAGDVLIKIDKDHWDNLNDEQQEALLDHELYHLSIMKSDGIAKRDDLGRFMFKLIQHDYEFGWFVEVAKRRGLASIEVQQAKRIMAENGQWLFSFTDQPSFHVIERGETLPPDHPSEEERDLEAAMEEAGPATPRSTRRKAAAK